MLFGEGFGVHLDVAPLAEGELQWHRPDVDLLAALNLDLLPRLNAVSTHVGTVGAATVDHVKLAADLFDLGML